MNKNNWTYKKLGEVCDFQGGSQPPKNEWSKEPKIGYVRMLQIRDFTQNATDYIEYVKESKSLKYCNEDDILIGRYGASVGKILSGLSGAYNVAIIKTIPRDIVNKNYIKYYFLSPYFQHNLLIVSQHRAAQAGFSKDDIVDFQIPCPSLAEQERIVAELDLLSSIIEKKKAQLKELDQLAQSIFYDMFGDPITNEKGWEVKKLGEMCYVITKGTTPTTLGFSFIEDGINFVKVESFINGRIDGSKLSHISQECHSALSRSQLNDDDLLVCIAGATIGKIAVVDSSILPANTNQACAIIRLKDNKIIKFIQSYLELKFEYDVIQMGKGVAQPNLSLGQLRNLPIILPPLPLQQKFASKIEAIERQKTLIQQSIDEVQTLFDSRMDYWFG